jgi:dephospho-CoA kinase
VLLVGLTGGIGAGKSTVSALLAGHGAEIIDADAIVRELQEPGSPVLAQMAERFGAHVILDDGSLDRAAVAAVVFGDSEEARAARADLNGIVHPALQREIRSRIEALSDTDRIVILDFPLLAENPRDDLDATIVVDVDPDIAVERLVAFRGMDADDAQRRIASQIDRAARRAIATHVIDNSADEAELDRRVGEVWDDLLRLRAEG